jgi:hypothetical protein
LDIAENLRNIEQTMLYVARVRDGPLANAAIDVLIAIHGEPDDLEKSYADGMTLKTIAEERKRAATLVSRRDKLRIFMATERQNISSDIPSLQRLETKYDIISSIIRNLSIGAGLLLFAFFIGKAFL